MYFWKTLDPLNLNKQKVLKNVVSLDQKLAQDIKKCGLDGSKTNSNY